MRQVQQTLGNTGIVEEALDAIASRGIDLLDLHIAIPIVRGALVRAHANQRDRFRGEALAAQLTDQHHSAWPLTHVASLGSKRICD
jgi:hypothetical protein